MSISSLQEKKLLILEGNMEQLQLHLNPRAHGMDPPSSHAAIERHEKQAQTNADIVLECLRIYPAMTAAELCHADERLQRMGVVEVRRRLSDLKVAGKAERMTCVKCAIAKTLAARWKPAK